MTAIRILAIVPEPVDAAWSRAAAAAWGSLQQCLQGLVLTGHIELVRLSPATANALSERLQNETFDVVHVVGRGSSRRAARHGTLTLEGSDRRARDLNVQNVAKACGDIAGLTLVVLEPLAAPNEFDMLSEALVERAASVVLLPANDADDGAERSRRLQALYMELAGNRGVEAAFAAMTHPALATHMAPPRRPSTSPLSPLPPPAHTESAQPRLVRRDQPPRAAPPLRARPVLDGNLAAAVVAGPPRAAPPVPDERQLGLERQLADKRAAGAFDVFLCHNVADKRAVLEIAEQLVAHAVLPWLDQWELRPGLPWQRLLEEQIGRIRTAAVFVGGGGIGPWQRQELDGFLREFSQRGCPVIPVLLPGASGEPELPLFLRAMTWVDFRVATPDPLSRLLWGITGVRV